MNLVKNGAILLAALSVFATTSCNNKKETYLKHDEALKWIEEHYTEAKPRTIEKIKMDWNYSGNKSNNKKLGDNPVWKQVVPGMSELDINGLSAYALYNGFSDFITEEDAKKPNSSVEKDVEDSSAFSWLNASWTKEKFQSRFLDKEYDEDTLKFYTIGNELKVVAKTKDQSVSGAVIELDMVETYSFDSKGFLKNDVMKMTSEICNCYLKNKDQKIDNSDQPLGKLSLSVTQKVSKATY